MHGGHQEPHGAAIALAHGGETVEQPPLALADQRRQSEADVHAQRIDAGDIHQRSRLDLRGGGGRRLPLAATAAASVSRLAARQPPGGDAQSGGDMQKRNMRHLRHQADGAHDGRRDGQRLRVFAELGLDLLADILAGGNAGDDQARRDGNGERGNLRGQTIAHRQQGIGARRIGQRQAVLQRADDQPAQHVDDQDDHRGDHVAAHEFRGAVHRAEKIRFAPQISRRRSAACGLRTPALISASIAICRPGKNPA